MLQLIHVQDDIDVALLFFMQVFYPYSRGIFQVLHGNLRCALSTRLFLVLRGKCLYGLILQKYKIIEYSIIYAYFKC